MPASCLRLARYAMARGTLLQRLLQRLATVPESVELARATGLTLPQIMYNAQMIRTWSLLLRNAQRQGYAIQHFCCLVCSHSAALCTLAIHVQPCTAIEAMCMRIIKLNNRNP